MADSGTKTYKAAKRYIYAWGGGKAEGNGGHEGPAGRQGRRPGRDDQRRSADASRLHHHHRSLQRLLRRRQEASRRPLGRRPGAPSRSSSSRPARASAMPKNPLLVSVRSGAKFSMPGMMDTVLNLGLNETTLQGLIANTRQRALRLRRLPPLHHRCSAASSWTSRPARQGQGRQHGRVQPLRRGPRRGQGEARQGRQGHRPQRRRSQEARRRVQEDRQGHHRPRLPRRSEGAAATWPSRPSSPPGSASAPSTTATARRSPTTSAPPSTS